MSEQRKMYADLKDELLITRDQIAVRVKEMGAEITRDFEGKDLTVICILKGAVVFFVDLIREIDLPMTMDFMAISSYGSATKSSGVVRILKDLDKPINGKDVLIIEDIVDSGMTLSFLKENLLSRGAASLHIATLLDSDSVKSGAAKELGLTDLDDYKVSVSSETITRVITLSVTGTDAKETAEVAKAIASSVSTVAQNVGAAQSINVIDEAKTPEAPSGPKRTLYIAVAFLAGIFIAVAYVVLADMLNTRIRGAEEAEELLGIPVVGRIPAMKGGK